MAINAKVSGELECPRIRFNVPMEQVNLDSELLRIMNNNGWRLGTYFDVQFLNHDETKLMACGRFVVSEEIETLQTNDANPYQPMTKTVFSRVAVQIGEWWPETKQEVEMVEFKFNETTPVLIEEPKRRGRPPKEANAV